MTVPLEALPDVLIHCEQDFLHSGVVGEPDSLVVLRPVLDEKHFVFDLRSGRTGAVLVAAYLVV